jgi:hypothetical protein
MMSAQAGTVCAAMTPADVDEFLRAIERALSACGWSRADPGPAAEAGSHGADVFQEIVE